MKLGFNLQNKLDQTQLSPTKCLVPLFEAIANSFNAIEEARIKNGKITISIHRDTSSAPGLKDIQPNQPVIGFTVEDNGIGFTDDNLKSFQEAYSARKKNLGGKGIGRVTWLKAFSLAEIDSVFENGQSNKRRTFTFAVSDDSEPVTTETDAERSTVVRLLNYLPDYRKECPSGYETIARRILAHFLESFILDNCPAIELRDEYEKTSQSLNKYFKNQLQLDRKTTRFQVDGKQFKIEHICLAALPRMQHEVHYCASRRTVVSQGLDELIPTLRGNLLHSSNKQFFYAGYVSGELFESTVDEMRGRFDIPLEKSLFGAEVDTTTWEKVVRKITEKANEYEWHGHSPKLRLSNDLYICAEADATAGSFSACVSLCEAHSFRVDRRPAIR